MELGLRYEFDVPQPWAGEHPWGQRMAERRVYAENLEQIVLADKMGFEAVWLVEHHFRENRSHMPCNDVVLGSLSQITKAGQRIGAQELWAVRNRGVRRPKRDGRMP